jgi:16S rRNA (cytosine967-C5)-methyltransferase
MIAPARVAAYDILTAVSAGNADLPTAIAFARAGLRDDRDRALASEIATGVQRWRASLDHLVAYFSKRSLDRLDPEIVEILRLGAYQLLHLTRVPASAVVDDAVDLARRAGKASAARFVNAVLRTIARNRHRPSLPPRPADTTDESLALDYLSITLSHPRWLAARWLARYGFENAERWCRFDNSAAPLTLRANTLKTSRDDLARALETYGIRTSPGRYAPDALIVMEGNPLGSPLADSGLFVVQDEASQLVPLAALAHSGETVLDACASPGGKTLALAAAVRPGGRVIAADVRWRRVALLRRTLTRAQMDLPIVQADLRPGLPFGPEFDCVLVDAPCSGLGTIRRDPEIRWRRDEAVLDDLAAAQTLMIDRAAAVVRPGGRLVYATCSSEPEENEAVVAAFLEAHPSFAPVDLREHPLPDPVRRLINVAGQLRTYPHRDGLEAFFAATLQRIE